MAAVRPFQGNADDQVAEAVCHFDAGWRFHVDRGCQRADALAVAFDDVGVQRDCRYRADFAAGGDQLIALGLASGECLANFAEVGGAVGDRGDQALDRLIGAGDLAIEAGAVGRAILCADGYLEVIAAHEVRDRIGTEQIFRQPGDHAAFNLDPLHGPSLAAGARFARAGATEAAVADDDDRSAACAAFEQAGQQVARAGPLVHRLRCPRLQLVLSGLPQGIVDDAKMRHVRLDPLVRTVRAGDAAARFRIAPHMDAVVAEPTDIGGVAEHPVAARVGSIDGAGAPFTAARAFDAILVQGARDRFCAATADKLAKDAADDDRLFLVHAAVATVELAARIERRHDVVAIGQAARHAAALNRAALAAPDLVSEIL